MLDSHQFIATLHAEFPEFRKWAWSPMKSAAYEPFDPILFVRFVTDELYEKGNDAKVDAVFRCLEQFLKDGTAEVREMIALGFLEPLRTLTSWKSYGTDALRRFLYFESQQIWVRLEAARHLSLDVSSVLEEEVIVWRVVRQSLAFSRLPRPGNPIR